MSLVVGLEVVYLHVDAELLVGPEIAIQARHNFRRAEDELPSSDLFGGNVLELVAVSDDQRAGFQSIVFKLRNLKARVDYPDVPALYVFDDDVQAVEARTKRNGFLIDGLKLH